MSVVKKQHYVPQFYLKQFAKASEQIFVYDKFNQSVYRSSVGNIASSNYFYDLSLETIAELEGLIWQRQSDANMDNELVGTLLQQIKDVQVVEKYLSRLETRFAKVLVEVVEGLEKRRRFKSKYRSEIALMAALQFWRTRERRENMMELEQKMEQGVMHLVNKLNKAKGTNFTAKDLGISFDPEETATRHKMMIFDRANLEETASIFNNHIWVIGVNETGNPLFTSDNPVAKRAHKNDEWRSNAGIASPGIEIAFPLTPKYVLIMYERSFFRDFQWRDGHLSYLKKDNITYYNSLQVYSSYRQVLSLVSNFDLIELMISKEPELKAPQSRWETPRS